MRRTILVAVIVLAASGCGGTTTSTASKAPCNASLSNLAGGGGGVAGRDGDNGHVLSRLSAFRRSRRASDVIPLAARDALVDGSLAKSSRRVFGDGGPGTVFVLPMREASDQSCLLVLYGIQSRSNCSTGFAFDEGAAPNTKHACAAATWQPRISGIAPNHVIEVELFVDRRPHHIAVNNNVYIYQSPPTKTNADVDRSPVPC
jgi:hypothetical protein